MALFVVKSSVCSCRAKMMSQCSCEGMRAHTGICAVFKYVLIQASVKLEILGPYPALRNLETCVTESHILDHRENTP